METKPNIEIETAEQNIQKLESHPNDKYAIAALCNEHEIIRLARDTEIAMSGLVNEYTHMLDRFLKTGESAICDVFNELMELKAQLRCRKDARSLYAHMLKEEHQPQD